MLELTREPRTDGFVKITAVVPESRLQDVELAIQEAAEPNVSASEVLKDTTPGTILRGARGLRELSQAQLAEKIGVHKSHISGMERGVRSIGKAMAKRLGDALEMNYKMFL